MIDMREFISSIAGVTERDEMLRKIAVIPDEEVRVLLALVSICWNKSIEINDAISAKQIKQIQKLEEQVKELGGSIEPYGEW